MEYYAIFVPDRTSNFSIKSFYNDKAEALGALKQHKDARMKAFHSNDEAVSFYLHGPSDAVATADTVNPPVQSPKIKATKCQFVGPTCQKLVVFRKLIEANNVEEVRATIYQNPRYLISSGDTPTILKVGPRYNALHIAAIEGRSEICRVILQAVEDVSYTELLHGLHTPSTVEVSAILLDLFLNTPDKSRNETPLHFASKHGWVDVVKELIAYPQCQVKPNADGLFPRDIVCSRARPANNTPEIREAITALFQETYFVPLIRTDDNMQPAEIGELFSPNKIPKLHDYCDKLVANREIKAYAGPMDRDAAERFRKRWKTPPRLTIVSPKKKNDDQVPSPEVVSSTPRKGRPLRLFTNLSSDTRFDSFDETTNEFEASNNNHVDEATNGSLEKTVLKHTADDNGNHLRMAPATPSRLFFSYRHITNSSFGSDNSSFCSDMDEPNFSYVCEESQTFYDKADIAQSPSFKERSLRLTDPEKGLELIGRTLALKENVGWKEYWKFLGQFANLADATGLSMFEHYLAQRSQPVDGSNASVDTSAVSQRSIETDNSSQNGKWVKPSNDDPYDLLCEATQKMTLQEMGNDGDPVPRGGGLGSSRMPLSIQYRCLLNSLQVFGIRFAKILLKAVHACADDKHDMWIGEAFVDAIRKLEILLENYQKDPAFQGIDFSKAHSLYACLVVASIVPEGSTIGKHATDRIFGTIRLLSLKHEPCTWKCVAKQLTHYSDNIVNVAQITTATRTEMDCQRIWDKNDDIIACNCRMDQYTHTCANGTLERMNKRREKRANRSIPRATEPSVVDFETYRTQPPSHLSDSLDDEELYYNCSDLENEDQDLQEEIYYTPSSSPQLSVRPSGVLFNGANAMDTIEGDCFEDTVCDGSFTGAFGNDADERDSGFLFISGTVPAKQDLDVWNVLEQVDIDPLAYPHVYAWKNAVASYNAKHSI